MKFRDRSFWLTLLRIAISLVTSVGAATAIYNLAIKNIISGWFPVVALSAIIAALNFAAWTLENRSKVKFKLTEGSQRFRRTFEDYYSKEGSLLILSNDVAWLEGIDNAGIMAAISQKGATATIGLRDVTSTVVEQLRRAGVKIIDLSSYNFSVRLSMISNGEKRDMMIRVKSERAGNGRAKEIWISRVEQHYQCEVASLLEKLMASP